MTQGWHIRDVYEQYREGRISFDDVMATAERGIVEYEQRRAGTSDTGRPAEPPTEQVSTSNRDSLG